MAGLSGLPALDITVQDTESLPARMAAISLLPDQTAAAKAKLQQQTQLAPLAVEEAKRQNQQQQVQAGNDMLAQIARDAQAADPDDAPNVWDEGMRKAASQGYNIANQYIGHFRPDLAERVGDIYGGAATPAGRQSAAAIKSADSNQAQIERAVSQMPQPKMQQAYKNLNTVITAFNKATTRDAWNEQMQYLKDQGIDVSQYLPSTDWNPLNYASAHQKVQQLTPYRDAMGARLSLAASGTPAAQPAPIGKSIYIGTQPGTNLPVYHNTDTNQDTVGTTPVGPKPTAAVASFMLKQQAWLSEHPGDTSGALQFANGTKSLPPERLRAIAMTEANKQLGDAVLAGEDIKDPDEWVRQKQEENFRNLQAASAAPGGGGSGGRLAATQLVPGKLPPQAMDAVRKAGGRPVTFNNGQSYKMGPDGKLVRLK